MEHFNVSVLVVGAVGVGKIVAFVINNPFYFVSHRLPIGLELLRQGYAVHLIAPDACPEGLQEQGFIYHQIKMSRKGKNPLYELLTVLELYRTFKKIKPDIVHLVTIKPYLYGGIAARMAKVPSVVSAVAGLGTLFIEQTFKYRFLRALLFPLYRFAFGHSNQVVVFQNSDDYNVINNWLGLDQDKAVLIRGSGVDLADYSYLEEPENYVPVVVFASRLLKDKGVLEFVEASRILQLCGIKAEFWLIGAIDLGNTNTVFEAELHEWQKTGLVKCLGYRLDVAQLFSKANIVVLPSYREGLPKVLVEAAASGRAVVTTNVPGCRDAIIPNETGLLVPPRDSQALADAIQQLITRPDLRAQMGRAGRNLAKQEFAIEKIVKQHMDIYADLLTKASI